MTTADRRTRVRSRPGGALTVILILGFTVAFFPLARMLDPQSWLLSSWWIMVVVLGLGYGLRRIAGWSVLTPVVQAAVAAALVTNAFAAPQAFAGFVPTPGSLRDLAALLLSGVDTFRTSVAPVEALPQVGALMTTIVVALAIALDLLVVRLRLVVLGAVALLALALFPSAFLPRDSDVVIAVAMLVLSAALFAAARPSPREARPRRIAAVAGVTVPAVLIALIVTPLVPLRDVDGPGAGLGLALSIDATIDLGRDLRNPQETSVLTIHSDASAAPYLRLATLSAFDGDVWTPDSTATPQDLDWLAQQRPLGAESDEADDAHAVITMDAVGMSMLPIPADATGVSGVSDEWSVQASNRTVSSQNASAAGLSYEVSFAESEPSTQQLRAATFASTAVAAGTRDIPADVPQLVSDELRKVTADADTTFDKLMALQSWFRSSEFTYSLDTPVDAGFDGAGVQAMDAFLTTKSGYCVHFASTFTVMARELGAPARVVLGFLPGTVTGDSEDGENVYRVTSGQLHTWPEVFFDDIGWVAFEPTASLGTPASFRTETTSQAPTAAPTTSASAQPSASASRTASAEREDVGDSPTVTGAGADLRVPMLVLIVPVLLALPALVRIALRRRRLRRASAGDAVAAWQELLCTAIDLGIPVDASLSPRAVAAQLRGESAELQPELARLVAAVEHQSYAPPGTAPAHRRGGTTVTSVAVLTAAWRSQASPLTRLRAAVLPRSLVRQPAIATRPADT